MALKEKKDLFVIQKHYATNLHYDFRLSDGKVLKSWAVPKNLPRKTSLKRLAIQVADHALSYAHFEGVIPKGEYGAGRVLIEDSGKHLHKTRNDKGEKLSISKALKMGHLEVELQGKKFKGLYALIRIKPKQWLIIKMKKKTGH